MSNIWEICIGSVWGGVIGMITLLLFIPSSPHVFGVFSASLGYVIGSIIGGIITKIIIAKIETKYSKLRKSN